MLRYAVAAATSLVLLTGLTACGGDPPPPRAQPSSTSTSPSATPPPTPPALPAAAKKNTKAGAEAFVRHYIDLVNYAQATGDVSALRAAESASCKSCRNGRRYLQRIHDAGGHVTGGRWHVDHITALHRGRSRWTIDVLGHFDPSEIYRSRNARPTKTRGGKAPVTIFVEHGERWKVMEWTRGI